MTIDIYMLSGNVDFEIILSIRLPLYSNDKENDIVNKLLDEMGCLSGKMILEKMPLKYESSLLQSSQAKQYIEKNKTLYPFFYNSKLYLFKVTVPFSNEWKLDNEEKGMHLSAEEGFVEIMRSELEFFVYRFSFALGIASYGLLDIGLTSILLNAEYIHRVRGVINSINWARDIENSKYDILNQISFQQILDWLFSIDDVLDCCGKTPLGKSLSIFSRMFFEPGHDTNYVLDGLLSVMALEALYESEGSRKDLANRISAFLEKDLAVVKEDVNVIYKHRCTIAHGGFAMPFNLCDYDASQESEKAFHTVGDKYWIGLQILFASYRKMIKLGLKELKFKTIWC